MPRVRAHNIAVSLDGFMAGADQRVDQPMGRDGGRLHEWVFATRTGRAMIGESGGSSGMDDRYLARGTEGIGATVMGRNMFGPVRGPWPDESWRGWWGEEPPYRHPVFVLTHHPRPPLEMAGGTTFHFVDDLRLAMERARAAAGELDIRVGGGADVLRQCLLAGLLDDLHVAIVPVMLGAGERLFDDVGTLPAYERAACESEGSVAHVRLVRTAP